MGRNFNPPGSEFQRNNPSNRGHFNPIHPQEQQYWWQNDNNPIFSNNMMFNNNPMMSNNNPMMSQKPQPQAAQLPVPYSATLEAQFKIDDDPGRHAWLKSFQGM